jgi:hypothetical protein
MEGVSGTPGIRNEAWETIIEEYKEPLAMISGPLALANQFAQTMVNAKNAEFNVKIPIGAEEWAETIFAKWFELMGQIAKSGGIGYSLLDRDLYDPIMENSPEWADGLTLEDLPHIEEEQEFEIDDTSEVLKELYGPFSEEPRMIFAFLRGKPQGRLSGQYNRLFPVKLVLRTAANLIASRDEYKLLGDDEGEYEYDELHLEDLREECLKIARYAKSRFEWIDARSGANMGERLSVGLPDRKGDPAKVKKQAERFVSQFVGSVRNKGQGLPFELGLLSVDEEGAVQFTENGVKFMLLKNPLFDTQAAWKDGESFTFQEKAFLVSMIRNNVPDEFEFMQKLATWISEGDNSPKPIEVKIAEEFGVNNTEASLMRSGTFARMIELSLINREQSGRNVSYSLTEYGEKFKSA